MGPAPRAEMPNDKDLTMSHCTLFPNPNRQAIPNTVGTTFPNDQKNTMTIQHRVAEGSHTVEEKFTQRHASS
ncbi:hypothetical protein VTN49DRAFT_6539 [Thermomyces lanuginosus]|uniref:uncharacterized protein n=1 Tax=Thermomyces lanuginosus TaxID=5541 RepID=UPI0037436AC6